MKKGKERQKLLFLPKVKGGILEASLAKLGVSAGRETGMLFDSTMSLSYSTCYPTSVLPEQRKALEKMERGLL